MDTIVRVTCPSCGDVEMAPRDLQLRVCSRSEASIYIFTCRRCEQVTVKPAADPRVATLLMSVGVPTVHWDLPAELDELHEGPALTIDDLIDLHFALERSDWAELLASANS